MDRDRSPRVVISDMLIYIPIINARIKNEESQMEGPAIHLVMTESLIIFEAIS